MKKTVFIILTIGITFFGCSDDSSDPVSPSIPEPVASFSYGGSTVTPASITFENNSENATEYLWNFGDGTTSTEETPSKTFDEMGTYNVTLTATNEETGESNQVSKTIVVTPGKVFLQKIVVVKLPFVDGSGSGWDVSSGPDLFFTLVNSMGAELITAEDVKKEDLTPASLPYLWTFVPEQELVSAYWNTSFSIVLWDYDATGNDKIGATTEFSIDQQMDAGYPSTVVLENSDKTIEVNVILKWQ